MTGVIYVKGSVNIDNTATVNLNKFTIFSETGGIHCDTKSNVNGPGSLIAPGLIHAQPHDYPLTDPASFIFILSTNSTVELWPNNGNFVGSIAGQTVVSAKNKGNITWVTPPDGLILPGSSGSGVNLIQEIAVWNIGLVDSSQVVVTTMSLPAGEVSVSYSQNLIAAGGKAPYTWALASGSLPLGLSMSASGNVYGTPTSAGVSTFTVRATDSASHSATQTMSITVNPAPIITTLALPGGDRGFAYYSLNLVAAGGTQPYEWSISSGFLPTGCVLNPSNGAISGTPTTVSVYPFTVTVTDAAGASASKPFSITVNDTLGITTTSLPDGKQNVLYSHTVGTIGGTTPFAWSITSGVLPAGLGINASGVISGTPTASGNFTFTVAVTDAAGANATQPLSIRIGPIITTTSLPTGTVGTLYSGPMAAWGGTGSYNWSIVAGALPTGLTLNISTGIISGTPAASGSFGFTVRLVDGANGITIQPMSIRVYDVLTISTISLPNGQVASPYNQTLVAAGGLAPYTWTISGVLPTGLTLGTSTGVISGTPSVGGSYSLTVQVTDSLGATATRPFSIAVVVALDRAPASSVAGGGFTNPNNALTQNGVYATATAPKIQEYSNFGFNIPPTATINGIAVSAYGDCDRTAYFVVPISLIWTAR